MDLFQKLGLHMLSWEDNMKEFVEEENISRNLKKGILKNGETVLLLQTKKPNEITHENLIWIHHFLINRPFNFINLKYVLLKENKDFFFAYEKVGLNLKEYFEETDLSFEVRLLIFKQAVEIVYYLTYLDENFSYFDFNLFFVEINSIQKLPILKLIPHCKNI